MFIPDNQIWIVVLGFIIAFILAFGIGANDVANSFGTSVGSKVLTLKQACMLATVFEVLGAILLGAKVSDTIRKMVSLPEYYQSQNDTRGIRLMMMGQLSSLSGACIWMLVATIFRLPVSGSHSIVGAVVGFALVVQGVRGINWSKLGLIVSSWFVSPILSGSVSILTFYIFDRLILKKDDPLEPGLLCLPFIYSITIAINVFSIFLSGPPLLGFNKIPLYGKFVLTIAIGIITLLIIRLVVVPYLRKKINGKFANYTVVMNTVNGGIAFEEKPQIPTNINMVVDNQNTSKDITMAKDNQQSANNITMVNDNHQTPKGITILEDRLQPLNVVTVAGDIHQTPNDMTIAEDYQNSNGIGLDIHKEIEFVTKITTHTKDVLIKDKPEQYEIFSGLQILTAIFGGFAHGGNDVSNAIGPLVGLWVYAITQNLNSKMEVPIWILFYGGAGITVGLWAWGRKVIQTLGEDLTTITPSSGVCIELGSAITVTIASNVGLPISTTHCKVGSIVGVGRFRSNENVDWTIFRNICIAWFVTLPLTGGVSALIMFFLKTWAL